MGNIISTEKTYSVQRDNNIRRRTYTYASSLPRTGNTPTNERDRPNARGIATRADEKHTTRNVTTTSVDERTDTNNLPRTGNTSTNERDRPKRTWHNDES